VIKAVFEAVFEAEDRLLEERNDDRPVYAFSVDVNGLGLFSNPGAIAAAVLLGVKGRNSVSFELEEASVSSPITSITPGTVRIFKKSSTVSALLRSIALVCTPSTSSA